MQLRMWTYDLAREQTPTYEHLRTFCDLTREGGYNAIGLYMEHRFAYPSTPWSHGVACVTPEMVRQLQKEYADLQIIPFLNLLGHFEGMLYTEEGHRYAEERFKGMQACPSKSEFIELAGKIVDDAISIFDSQIIHIGGDETWQLGCCEKCTDRVSNPTPTRGDGEVDGKAVLYGEHFGPLAQKVVDAGRRPAVWGDMFFDHPQALQHMPKNTLIFDWQYFKGPEETSRRFFEAGHEVVFCPALHTYNATWLHLPQSEQNVIDHVRAAHEMNAYGVCVTTWELGLFGNYETIIPAIRAAGQMVSTEHETFQAGKTYVELSESPDFLRAYLKESERHEEWARLMGVELQQAGGMFAFGGIRSSMKCRLLLYSNPFLFWLHHREELCGDVGNRALETITKALNFAPNSSYRGISEFGKGGIEFVRFAELAHQAYAQRKPGEATTHLSVCRQIFENLENTARATHVNIGGSLADVERCRIARQHVETVIRRVKEYGDGSLGYLPSFEMITHPKFVPHDQAGWWLINRWANE